MENSLKPIAPRREHTVAFVNLNPRMNVVRFEPAEDVKVVPLQYVEHSITWEHRCLQKMLAFKPNTSKEY